MTWGWYKEKSVTRKYYVLLMDDIELACGCSEVRTRYIYDKTGNKPQYFASEEEAEKAANSPKYAQYDRYSVCLNTR